MAQAIKERDPEVSISVFYIDLQPVGKSFEEYLERCRADLILVRTMVGDIYPVENGKLRISYQSPETHMLVDEEFDLAVLSVGISPGNSNEFLSSTLGVNLDASGFFEGNSDYEGNLTAREGVVLAGTAKGPRDIADTIAHAKRAAWEVVKTIGGKS